MCAHRGRRGGAQGERNTEKERCGSRSVKDGRGARQRRVAGEGYGGGVRNRKIEIENNAKPEKTQLEKRTSEGCVGGSKKKKRSLKKKEKDKTEKHLKKQTDRERGRTDKSSCSSNLLFRLSIHVFLWCFFFSLCSTETGRDAREAPHIHTNAPHMNTKTCKRENGEATGKHADEDRRKKKTKSTQTANTRQKKKRKPNRKDAQSKNKIEDISHRPRQAKQKKE